MSFSETRYNEQGYPDRESYAGSYRSRRNGRSSDLVTAFSDAVRDNPVPAALIGMGALWLFMGGGNMTLLGGRGKGSVFGSAARGASNVAHAAGETAHSAADAVGRMGSSVASGVSSTVSGIADTVSDTAGRVGDYVSGALHGADAEAGYRNPSFSGENGGGMGRTMSSPFAAMQDLFERHPLALGAAGLAIGAGIAASLPVTSTERETLGKATEAMRSKLGEATEQAKEMASAMVDEVKQQAGTTGHGPG